MNTKRVIAFLIALIGLSAHAEQRQPLVQRYAGQSYYDGRVAAGSDGTTGYVTNGTYGAYRTRGYFNSKTARGATTIQGNPETGQVAGARVRADGALTIGGADAQTGRAGFIRYNPKTQTVSVGGCHFDEQGNTICKYCNPTGCQEKMVATAAEAAPTTQDLTYLAE